MGDPDPILYVKLSTLAAGLDIALLKVMLMMVPAELVAAD